MKTKSVKWGIMAMALLSMAMPFTAKAQDKVEASAGVDLVSGYVWRGQDLRKAIFYSAPRFPESERKPQRSKKKYLPALRESPAISNRNIKPGFDRLLRYRRHSCE